MAMRSRRSASRAPVEHGARATPPVNAAGLATWLARNFPDVATIDVPALAHWLDDRSRARPTLVDVRAPGEQAVSTLPGALCVAPGDDAADVLRRLDPARPIVVYCSVGVRSARLARALAAAGAASVCNLRGGIFDWANRGLPLAGPAGAAGRVHGFDATWQVLLAPSLRA
jgi:rhodanese-related sulfurtransferase